MPSRDEELTAHHEAGHFVADRVVSRVVREIKARCAAPREGAQTTTDLRERRPTRPYESGAAITHGVLVS